MNRRRLYFIITFLALFVVVGYIIVWISGNGFFIASVDTNENKDVKFSFYGNGQSYYASSNSGSIKKRLPRGSYLVIAQSGEKSYVKQAQNKGWLKTTAVAGGLSGEKSREFVGDNPGYCMHYGNVLYSYDCAETGGLKAHIPATPDVPSYTVTEQEPPYTPLKNLLGRAGQTKAFVVDPDSHGSESGVELYDLNEALNFSNKIILSGIRSEDNPSAINFGDGILVYSSGFNKILSYKTSSSDPNSLGGLSPKEKNMKPVELSQYSKRVGALYNNSDTGDDSEPRGANDENKRASLRGKSEFSILGERAHFVFNKLYTSGILCGEKRLCLMANQTLDMYDISGKKPKQIISIPKVNKVVSSDGYIDLFAENGLISLDENSLSGEIIYSFSYDRYCGSEATDTGHILCVVNEKGGPAAILINKGSPNNDSIDKKIDFLLMADSINDVSVYKNHIYISPKVDSFIYDPVLGINKFDPEKLRQNTASINDVVKKSNIDTQYYKIQNVLE